METLASGLGYSWFVASATYKGLMSSISNITQPWQSSAMAEQRHGKEEALAKCARALARGGGAGTASGVQLLQLDRHGFGHGVTGKVVRQDPASFPDIGSNGDRQRFAAGRGQNSGICRDCVAQWG